MNRFLQHTLPRHFARVRTFGWLHPAAKVRLNRVRALLRQEPLLNDAEKNTWHPPAAPKSELPAAPATTVAAPDAVHVPVRCAASVCLRCQKEMRLLGRWRAGQMMFPPNGPP